MLIEPQVFGRNITGEAAGFQHAKWNSQPESHEVYPVLAKAEMYLVVLAVERPQVC